MTINYEMIVAKYPKPYGVAGGSIIGREIFSLLDKKTSQVVTHLVYSTTKRYT